MILMFLLRNRIVIWPFTVGYIAIIVSWRVHLVLSGAGAERTYNGFDTHSDTLLIGCTLALIEVRPQIARYAKRFELIACAAMVFVFICVPYNLKITQAFGLSLVGLLSAWILIAAIQDGNMSRLLSTRPLVYTGKISYGWYLWHYPILVLGSGHVSRFEKPFLMAFSFLIASFSYHFIERPFLRQKSRFERNRTLKNAASVVPL
jgi:peptidoglycan/LPS O-acetylase OafA/YrhL